MIVGKSLAASHCNSCPRIGWVPPGVDTVREKMASVSGVPWAIMIRATGVIFDPRGVKLAAFHNHMHMTDCLDVPKMRAVVGLGRRFCGGGRFSGRGQRRGHEIGDHGVGRHVHAVVFIQIVAVIDDDVAVP